MTRFRRLYHINNVIGNDSQIHLQFCTYVEDQPLLEEVQPHFMVESEVYFPISNEFLNFDNPLIPTSTPNFGFAGRETAIF